ncbi:metallophosphoesterase [Candidatus Bathyarchaeota archaeon]|nr:metallophosphoesterase [Candidatus Bathyarchaeota archaeon]
MLKLLIPRPAALIKSGKAKTLVIADPHIGWEIALQSRGINVPSQTSRLLQQLVIVISKYKPDALLILGDVKNTVVTAKSSEWHDIPEFFTDLENYVKDIAIVRGNHDANLEPLLPESVRLLPSTGTAVGNVGFFHGHKWPSPALLKCRILVMGHLHPVVVFRDPAGFKITSQVWVKAKCDTNQLSKVLLQKQRIKIEGTPEETVEKYYDFKPKTCQLFIMPSFNDFLGGRPINLTNPTREGKTRTMIGPVLRSEAVDLNNSEIYLLDGTYLGTLNQLRKI